MDAASASETHYKNLLTKLPSGQDALHGAYEAIEKIVRDVDSYVHVSDFNYHPSCCLAAIRRSNKVVKQGLGTSLVDLDHSYLTWVIAGFYLYDSIRCNKVKQFI